MIKLCNETNKISFCKKHLYTYRVRQGSSLGKGKLEKLEKDYIYTAKKILMYLERIEIKDKEILNFKIMVFSNNIERIKKINKANNKIYNLLDEDFIVKTKEIFKLRKIKKKTLVKIFLWKLKLYHLQNKI